MGIALISRHLDMYLLALVMATYLFARSVKQGEWYEQKFLLIQRRGKVFSLTSFNRVHILLKHRLRKVFKHSLNRSAFALLRFYL